MVSWETWRELNRRFGAEGYPRMSRVEASVLMLLHERGITPGHEIREILDLTRGQVWQALKGLVAGDYLLEHA